jgi:hypothetical protein
MMQKIGVESKNVKNGLDQVSNAASGLGNIFKMVGISFGAFQIFSMMKEGVEKVHALHQAEAQLANTMQNMGVYSQEAYEKAIKVASDMSKSVLFSKSEIIGLQSQLRMVGNIGEGEMSKLAMASADMATKFGMGLTEAGNAIAKAVNNPEMMRRLAMQLKIDPSLVDKIQAIAKAGNEAKARLMLIDVVQQKVGGAAQAAFNADPLARYNKTMGSIKMTLGEVAVSIQKTLAPVMEIISVVFQKAVKWLTDTFGGFFDKLKNGDPVITGITVAIGALAATIGIITTVVKIWTTAQWLLNVAMTANPVGLIIAAIVALIAIIAYVAYTTDGWGKTWDNVMKWMKLGIELFKESVSLKWLEIKNVFLSGFEVIEKGWYKMQSLWDKKGADAGLAALESQRNARLDEIAASKGKIEELKKQMSDMTVWEVKSNGKGLKDIMGDIKQKLGISAPGVPGANTTGVAGTGGAMGSGGTGSNAGKDTANSIATGGTKTTHITINLGELVGTININKNGFRESVENMRDIVLDEMTRVLSMAQGQTI